MNLAERIAARKRAEQEALKLKWEQEKQEALNKLGVPNYERILDLLEESFNANTFKTCLKIANAGNYKTMVEYGTDYCVCAIAIQHFDLVKSFLIENGFVVNRYGCYDNTYLQIRLPE